MELAAKSAATSGASVSPSRQVRVICAVSAEERRLFLAPASAQLSALPISLAWVLTDEAAVALRQIEEANPDVLITGWSTPPLSEAWLASPACRLRYICHVAGAVRWLVPRCFLERGGIVTNWGDLPSGAVAEHALLLALAGLRNLARWPDIVRGPAEGGSHIERLQTRSLFGRTVGVHGFGRVARALVLLLKPFGVAIHAYSAGVPIELMRKAGVIPAPSLESLATVSEVFFECEALIPQTQGSVTPDVMAALPPGAVFVNVGRGGVVDEPALLRAAESGRIRVALDVFVTEPLVPNAAFCRLPGAVLSPHIAGPTFDQYPKCGEHVVRNLQRFLAGEPLRARLTLEEYDRTT